MHTPTITRTTNEAGDTVTHRASYEPGAIGTTGFSCTDSGTAVYVGRPCAAVHRTWYPGEMPAATVWTGHASVHVNAALTPEQADAIVADIVAHGWTGDDGWEEAVAVAVDAIQAHVFDPIGRHARPGYDADVWSTGHVEGAIASACEAAADFDAMMAAAEQAQDR